MNLLLIEPINDALDEKFHDQLFVLTAWKRYKEDIGHPEFAPKGDHNIAMANFKRQLQEINEKTKTRKSNRIEELPGFQEWLKSKRK
jgi:hypothetical protein